MFERGDGSPTQPLKPVDFSVLEALAAAGPNMIGCWAADDDDEVRNGVPWKGPNGELIYIRGMFCGSGRRSR